MHTSQAPQPHHDTVPSSDAPKGRSAVRRALAKVATVGNGMVAAARARHAARIARESQPVYSEDTLAAIERQDRPLPEGSQVARAQAALDKLAALRDAREAARGERVTRSRVARDDGAQRGRTTQFGAGKDVSLDIRTQPGDPFDRRNDWDSYNSGSVRLIDSSVVNPLHPTCHLGSVFMDRRTFVNPENGSLTDTLTVEVTSFPREAGYSFRDKFVMEAHPDGSFGPARQMSEARIAGAPNHVAYRRLSPSEMPKNQDEVNLNFDRVMGMVEEVTRRVETQPDPAAS